MEQIIYLGQDDELTNVLERVALAREQEVVLVVPDRAQALKSSVNLKLLQRRATAQNKRITLITGDPQLHAVAEKLGFTTELTLEIFQKNMASGRYATTSPPSPLPHPHKQITSPATATMKRPSASTEPAPDSTTYNLSPFKPGKALFFQPSTAGRLTAGSTSSSLAKGMKQTVYMALVKVFQKLWLAPQIRVVLVGLVLLGLLFGSLFFYFTFPEAEVLLSPQVQPVTKKLQLVASIATNEINWQQKRVPAHLLTFPVNLDSATGIATGHKVIPDGRAQGQVIFSNRLGEAIEVPKGTILGTSGGIRFRTTQAVTIEAATEDLTGITFGKNTVAVEAVEPGPAGNADPYQIRLIDPNAGLSNALIVFNRTPLTGGTQRTVTVITTADIERVQLGLHNILQTRAAAFFAQQSAPESISAALPTVERVELDHQVGEIATKFRLTLHLQSQALVVRSSDINSAAEQILANDVRQTRPGFVLLSNTSKAQLVPAVSSSGPLELPLVVQSTGQIAQQIRISALQEQLAGKSTKAALAYLKTMPNLISFHLILKPSWAGHLSVLTSRTTIRIVPPSTF